MAGRKPNLYIIAGPNGAGKTTFAREFLPHYVDCMEFVNADLIAYGLSPFSPERAAIRAGKLVLEQIHALGRKGLDFGFESTLSGKTQVRLLREFKATGYNIHMFYLWVRSVDLALERIADRVKKGGHSVPEETVRRRFGKSLSNFIHLYRSLTDSWHLFDNSSDKPVRVALYEGKLKIFDAGLYAQFCIEENRNEKKS
jgi:predicted ABC-type ATPase